MDWSPGSNPAATVVTRRLSRHPDDVWEHLTGDEGFEDWMGNGSTIEAQPGGRLIAADPESGQAKIGQVLEVEPGRRLHWVWRPLGENDPTTEVIVTIEPDPDEPPCRTLITVTEQPSTLGVALASTEPLSVVSSLSPAC